MTNELSSKPRYVYQCSNPACGQIWESAPYGFCPACKKPDGSGWTTITIVPKRIQMSEVVPTEKQVEWDPKLGPRPLPTFHGKGCICHMYARPDCPAAQTEEGKRRDTYRKLNGARVRVRNAQKNVVVAAEELVAAQHALDMLEHGP